MLPQFKTADKFQTHLIQTGIYELDTTLHGGLEIGMTHLFYGNLDVIGDDLIQIALSTYHPKQDRSPESKVIVLDGGNLFRKKRVNDTATRLGEREWHIRDSLHVVRTDGYWLVDTIMNRIAKVYEQHNAKMLIVPALPELIQENYNPAEASKHIVQTALRLHKFSMRNNIVTVVSASHASGVPNGGETMSSCCQVHVLVEKNGQRVDYTLTSHPYLEVERPRSRPGSSLYAFTPPLETFFEDDL